MATRLPKPKTSSWSLAQILAITFISLSIAALLLNSGLLVLANARTQQAAIASQQERIAREAAGTVGSFIEKQFGAMETAIRVTDLATSSPEAWVRVLRGLLGSDPSFKHLVLLDDKNLAIARASRASEEELDHFVERVSSVMLSEIQQHERFIGPVFIDDLTNEPQIIAAIPARSVFGDRYGTLIADINLKFMWDLVQQLQVGDQGYAYVVDRQGNLLAAADTTRVLKGENVAVIQTVAAFVVAAESTETAAIQSYLGLNGGTVVGSYVPLDNPDWAVVTEIPWSEAYQDVIGNILIAIALMLALAVLSGGVGAIAARRMTVPLVDLMRTATRISDGESGIQATVAGPREVAALAVAFNRMTAQLRSLLNDLEQRVTQRTQDLQAALAEVKARSDEQERLISENMLQRQTIRDLSVPILPVTSDTLVMPLIGAFDGVRIEDIQQRALAAIERTRARRLLLDVTGVPLIDSQVAQGIVAVAQAVRLLGAEIVLIGIRPEVAQTIVSLGLDLSTLKTSADLQAAVATLQR